jgi:hypothetical protein
MSDKPVQMTIQGTYRGYSVSVSLECSLDSLDKAIDRLQARGIEPLHQPVSAGSQPSQGSKQPVDVLEGTYQHHWFREPGQKGPVCKVSLALDDGSTRTADFWQQEPRDLFALGQGARVRMFGRAKTSTDTVSGKQYQNFSVSRWEAA